MASRLAALLLAPTLPTCSLIAPEDPGATPGSLAANVGRGALGAAKACAAASLLASTAGLLWVYPDQGPFRPLGLTAITLGLVVGRWRADQALAAVLALGPVWLVLSSLALGVHDVAATGVWLALLAGVLLGSTPWRRWHVPLVWQVPLAAWALVLATGWPIVLWRELDFTTPATVAALASSSWGTPAPYSAMLATLMSLAQLGAIFLFDALWKHRDGLERIVVWPLTGGVVIAVAVGIAQGVGDLSWLSGPPWPLLGRAAGTFFDANAFGATSALWGATAGGVLLLQPARGARMGGATLLIAAGAGVWMSGSRTALLGLLVIAAGTLLALLRTVSKASRVALVAGAMLLPPALLAAAAESGSGTALNRLRATLPAPRPEAIGRAVRALWDRDGYGVAAAYAIRAVPLTGGGPGAFQLLVPDYARVTLGRSLPPDNAQNWWRHQLAELGFLGAWAPWLSSLLVGGVGVALLRRNPQRHAPVLLAALVALGLMALVGPPTAHPIVLQIATVVVAWAARTASLTRDAAVPSRAFALWGGALVGVTAAVWTGGTVLTALNSLRPPYRAVDAGWTYGYGFSAPELVSGGEQRWAAPRAVGVIPAVRSRLVLTFELPHDNLAARPVRLRIWDRHRALLDTVRRSPEPFVHVVEIAKGEQWALVELRADRDWQDEDGTERALRVTARFE